MLSVEVAVAKMKSELDPGGNGFRQSFDSVHDVRLAVSTIWPLPRRRAAVPDQHFEAQIPLDREVCRWNARPIMARSEPKSMSAFLPLLVQ
jgi:hypothetical protein